MPIIFSFLSILNVFWILKILLAKKTKIIEYSKSLRGAQQIFFTFWLQKFCFAEKLFVWSKI